MSSFFVINYFVPGFFYVLARWCDGIKLCFPYHCAIPFHELLLFQLLWSIVSSSLNYICSLFVLLGVCSPPLLANSNVSSTKQPYVWVFVDGCCLPRIIVLCVRVIGYLFPRCWQTATFWTRSNTMFRFAWTLPPKTTYVDSVGLFCFVLFFFPVPSSPLPGLVRTKKKRAMDTLPSSTLSPVWGLRRRSSDRRVSSHVLCAAYLHMFRSIHKRTSIDHRFNTIHSLFAVRTSWIFSIPFLLVSRFLPRRPILLRLPGLEPFRPSPLTTYIHILHTYIPIYEAHSPPSHNTPQLTRTPAGGSPNNTNTPRISVIIVVTHILRFFVVPASIHKHDVIVGAALFVKIGKILDPGLP